MPFSDARPFHPARLHEALSSLLGGIVRTRGRLWLASQPDLAFWLETAGGSARMGQVEPWLASTRNWDEASPQRRAMAALVWDERFGDRRQELAVIAHDVHPGDVVAALQQALLDPRELAAGETVWSDYDDPFEICAAAPRSAQYKDNT